jgi:hypothetical protein
MQNEVAVLRAANASLKTTVESLQNRLASIESTNNALRVSIAGVQGKSDVSFWLQVPQLLLTAVTGIWISLLLLRHRRRVATRDATERIFAEWWSDDLAELRQHFREFTAKHRARFIGKGMKQIANEFREDGRRTQRFCFFFDKVGWLGAAGLIDVDYVLAPMQHAMRRCWIAMEPLIKHDREPAPGQSLDPVYQWGFEWLYKRSSEAKHHQANLLRTKFSRPRLRSDAEIMTLKEQIDKDEKQFKQILQSSRVDCELGGPDYS